MFLIPKMFTQSKIFSESDRTPIILSINPFI